MKNRFLFLVLLSASLLTGEESVLAQPAEVRPYPLNVQNTLRNAGIDLGNAQLVRSIVLSSSDTIPRHIAAFAAVYLAERGDVTIIDTVKHRFQRDLNSPGRSLQRLAAEPYTYLYALFLLRAPEVSSYAYVFLDSLLARKATGETTRFLSDGSSTLRLLVSMGDRSRYGTFELIMDENIRRNAVIDFPLLVAFAAEPSLRPVVFNRLRSLLNSQNADYRFRAVSQLAESFRDFNETRTILQNLATSDRSKNVWSIAILSLVNHYGDAFALTACERIAKVAADTGSFARALSYIEMFPSPLALVTLQRIQASLSPGYLKDFITSDIQEYRPPKTPGIGKPLSQLVDSLSSYTDQVLVLSWLGDANFAKELANGLDNAKKHFVKKDSVNAYKEVQTFQDKVNKEYEKTVDNQKKGKPRDRRFVTVEGWKFLYYNAQYIMDRLPSGKKK